MLADTDVLARDPADRGVAASLELSGSGADALDRGWIRIRSAPSSALPGRLSVGDAWGAASPAARSVDVLEADEGARIYLPLVTFIRPQVPDLKFASPKFFEYNGLVDLAGAREGAT